MDYPVAGRPLAFRSIEDAWNRLFPALLIPAASPRVDAQSEEGSAIFRVPEWFLIEVARCLFRQGGSGQLSPAFQNSPAGLSALIIRGHAWRL